MRNIVEFTRSADYLHQRAVRSHRANRVLDALDLMRRAVEREPHNMNYLADLKELYRDIGLYSAADRVLTVILSHPNSQHARLEDQAVAQLAQKRHGFLERRSRRIRALNARAEALINAERYEYASKTIEKSAAILDTAACDILRALLAKKKGDLSAAKRLNLRRKLSVS